MEIIKRDCGSDKFLWVKCINKHGASINIDGPSSWVTLLKLWKQAHATSVFDVGPAQLLDRCVWELGGSYKDRIALIAIGRCQFLERAIIFARALQKTKADIFKLLGECMTPSCKCSRLASCSAAVWRNHIVIRSGDFARTWVQRHESSAAVFTYMSLGPGMFFQDLLILQACIFGGVRRMGLIFIEGTAEDYFDYIQRPSPEHSAQKHRFMADCDKRLHVVADFVRSHNVVLEFFYVFDSLREAFKAELLVDLAVAIDFVDDRTGLYTAREGDARDRFWNQEMARDSHTIGLALWSGYNTLCFMESNKGRIVKYQQSANFFYFLSRGAWLRKCIVVIAMCCFALIGLVYL